MLSRNGQGLYWIGRYLERAQRGCRLLADQLQTIEDRSIQDIDRSWRRLYGGIGRSPSGGDLESNWNSEGFMLADAYTLVDDLTFDLSNADSVLRCLSEARNNAREVGHIIGPDIWSSLNVAFLELSEVTIGRIWNDRPRDFFVRAESSIHTVSGTADNGIYRDAAWHFLRLGRFVERIQAVAALADSQLTVTPETGSPPIEARLAVIAENLRC